MLEGYGLTETSAATPSTATLQLRYRGDADAGHRGEIAGDGEILIRGPGVMRGYYNRPEDTAEALEPDGWLHTGDIGVVDEDRFLKITDRKKDIIVTAGGKNIAPQNIENQLKAGCRYISQVVMLGDRRPFCVALITINEETVGKWAAEQGITYATMPTWRRGRRSALIWNAVQEVNRSLASYETIKRIHLLDHDFSQETGELTPKMSIKRKVVEEKNRGVVEAFYAETLQRV